VFVKHRGMFDDIFKINYLANRLSDINFTC